MGACSSVPKHQRLRIQDPESSDAPFAVPAKLPKESLSTPTSVHSSELCFTQSIDSDSPKEASTCDRARSASPEPPMLDLPSLDFLQRQRRAQGAAGGDEDAPRARGTAGGNDDAPRARGAAGGDDDAPRARGGIVGAVPGQSSSFGRGSSFSKLMTSDMLREAEALPGRCRPFCVGLASVELKSGLARLMRPLVLFTFLVLAAALGTVALIFWTPAYRLYWLLQPPPPTLSLNASSLDRDALLTLENAPMPPNCQSFSKSSGSLTAGIENLLDSTIQVPYLVDALPNQPTPLGPGTSLHLLSLVVDEIHHGRWTFGMCWGSPWWETIPDQFILRLRNVGVVATLILQIVQHVPMLGEVVLTTGSATVQGHGIIYLDDIDLDDLARPVKSCSGRFLFRMVSASFDVGGCDAPLPAARSRVLSRPSPSRPSPPRGTTARHIRAAHSRGPPARH